MDWTKAKTILLIALLITNLFLGAIYVFAQIRQNEDEEMLQKETIALLEAKQIYVETVLPLKHNKMPVLNIRYDRMDPDLLEEQLASQTPLPENRRSREYILGMAGDFLYKCGILAENVVLDRVEERGTETIVSYKNVYEGISIEESYIQCTVKDGMVTELTRYWLHPIDFGRTKKATMSASAALIHFMSGKDSKESIKVEDMSLVYWLDPSAYGMETTVYDTAFPAWKVTYNGGKIRYIPAYME